VDRVEEICAVAGVSFLHFNVSFEGSLLASRTAGTSTRVPSPFAEGLDAAVARPTPDR
jgi:hypothetical protein